MHRFASAVSTTKIEAALDYLAFLIESDPGGHCYLPIYDRLERELTIRCARADSLRRRAATFQTDERVAVTMAAPRDRKAG